MNISRANLRSSKKIDPSRMSNIPRICYLDLKILLIIYFPRNIYRVWNLDLYQLLMYASIISGIVWKKLKWTIPEVSQWKRNFFTLIKDSQWLKHGLKQHNPSSDQAIWKLGYLILMSRPRLINIGLKWMINQKKHNRWDSVYTKELKTRDY